MSRAKAEFELSAQSGVIAAATAADAKLFVWRSPLTLADGSANVRGQRVRRIEAFLVPESPPSAGNQVLGIRCSRVASITANASGGTDLSHPTTDANKAYRAVGPDPGPNERTAGQDPVSVLQSGNVMIATTGALTNAATAATHSFAWAQTLEAVAASRAQGAQLIWQPSHEASRQEKGAVLKPDQGFYILLNATLAAGCTARLFVRVSWVEL